MVDVVEPEVEDVPLLELEFPVPALLDADGEPVELLPLLVDGDVVVVRLVL